MKPRPVKLFHPIPNVKPSKRALTSHVFFTTSAILKVLEKDKSYYVEGKRDGLTMFCHRDGGKILFLSDEEKEISAVRIAIIKKEVRDIFPRRCIIMGELLLTGTEGKSSEGHQAISGYIHRKNIPTKEEQNKLRFYYWDILYLGEKDLTHEPLTARKKLLAFKDTAHIKENSYLLIANGLSAVRKAVKKMKTIEGAMIKRADGIYWNANALWKIKKFFDIDVIVKKVIHKISGNVYDCTDREGNFIGTTYKQGYIKAKPGDIIRVMVTKVFRHIDKETGKETFRWYSPVVKRPEMEKDEGLKREKIVKRHPKEADGQNVLREIWKATTGGKNGKIKGNKE